MYTNLKEKNYNKILIASLVIIYLVIAYGYPDNSSHNYYVGGIIFFGLSFLPLILTVFFENDLPSLEIIKEIFDSKNYLIIAYDENQKLIFINKEANDFFAQKHPLDYFSENVSNENNSSLLKIRASHLGKFNNETDICLDLKEKGIAWYKVITKKLKNNEFVWVIEDISAKIAILEAIDKDNKFLSKVINNVPSGLCIVDIEGNIKYINSAFLRLTGYIEPELIGTNLSEITLTKIKDLTFNNQEIIYVKSKNQDTIKLLTSKSMHEVFGENFIYLSCLKIEDEDTEEKQETKPSPFTKLFTESPIGIVFCTNWGDIIDANYSMQKMLKLKDPLGSSILNYIAVSDRSYFLSRLEKLTILGNIPYASFNVEMITNHDEEDSKPISALVYITPRKDENNFVEGATLHFIDVTEEKNMMEQLQKTQKEQTLGMIASGVAHEVNNRIATIKMSADLLMMASKPSDPSYIEAVKISEGVNRVKETVSSLLFRIKKQESKKDYVPADKIVSYYNQNYIRSILNPDIKDKIRIITEFSKDLGYLRVDLTQIYNSIDNLIINASDAMAPKGGELFVKISNEVFQKPHEYHIYNSHETILPGEYILIEVTDTGCGIENENLSKIFDHYFTTKKNFKNSGSGVGLSIVYGAIRQSEGYIVVKSKVNEGTSFKILLPKIKELPKEIIEKQEQTKTSLEPNKKIKQNKKKSKHSDQLSFDFDIDNEEEKPVFKASSLAIAEQSGIRVLLIEDNDDIRFLAEKIISNLGYEVVACECAEDAHEIIKKDKNFTLMLSDVMMPGMSGLDFLKIIRKEIKNIKVIIMSGYSEGLINEEETENENLKIISKPFSVAELSSKIKELLNQ